MFQGKLFFHFKLQKKKKKDNYTQKNKIIYKRLFILHLYHYRGYTQVVSRDMNFHFVNDDEEENIASIQIDRYHLYPGKPGMGSPSNSITDIVSKCFYLYLQTSVFSLSHVSRVERFNCCSFSVAGRSIQNALLLSLHTVGRLHAFQ